MENEERTLITLLNNPKVTKEQEEYLNTLTTLNLSSKPLSISQIRKICEILATKNTSISILNLENTNIDDMCASKLAELLILNKSLKSLNLWGNKITERGATKIAEALQSNTTLKDLNLYMNKIRTKGAMKFISSIEKNVTLERLDIGANEIELEFNDSIHTSLRCNYALNYLNLNENLITESTLSQISAIINDNQRKLNLLLERNDLRIDQIPKLYKSTNDRIEFLKKIQKRKRIITKYAIMVIGEAGVGKTTLIKKLIGSEWMGSMVEAADAVTPNHPPTNNNHSTSSSSSSSSQTFKWRYNITDGIDINHWDVPLTSTSSPSSTSTFTSTKNNNDNEGGEGEEKRMIISCFDFAGQEIYHSTHEFFMGRSRCIYLLLIDASKPLNESKLTHWLYTITSRSPSVNLFLIATHLDSPHLLQQSLQPLQSRLTSFISNLQTILPHHHNLHIIINQSPLPPLPPLSSSSSSSPPTSSSISKSGSGSGSGSGLVFWPLSITSEDRISNITSSSLIRSYRDHLFTSFRTKLLQFVHSSLYSLNSNPNLHPHHNNDNMMMTMQMSNVNEEEGGGGGEVIPSSWVYLRQILVLDSSSLASMMMMSGGGKGIMEEEEERRRTFPVYSLPQIKTIAAMCLVGEDEIIPFLDLLSSWGDLLFIPSSNLSSSSSRLLFPPHNKEGDTTITTTTTGSGGGGGGDDYVVLRPNWLIEIFKVLVSIRHQLKSPQSQSHSKISKLTSKSSSSSQYYHYTLTYDQLFQRYLTSFPPTPSSSSSSSSSTNHHQQQQMQQRHNQMRKIIELWYHLQLIIPLKPHLYLILPLLPKHSPQNIHLTLQSLISSKKSNNDVIIMKRIYKLHYLPPSFITRILFELSHSPSSPSSSSFNFTQSWRSGFAIGDICRQHEGGEEIRGGGGGGEGEGFIICQILQSKDDRYSIASTVEVIVRCERRSSPILRDSFPRIHRSIMNIVQYLEIENRHSIFCSYSSSSSSSSFTYFPPSSSPSPSPSLPPSSSSSSSDMKDGYDYNDVMTGVFSLCLKSGNNNRSGSNGGINGGINGGNGNGGGNNNKGDDLKIISTLKRRDYIVLVPEFFAAIINDDNNNNIGGGDDDDDEYRGGGKYEDDVRELEIIGEGAGGVVRRGIWKGKYDVAIKQPPLSDNIAALISEIELMRRINHPNIVRLYFVYEKPFSIITEYCKIGDLQHLISSSSSLSPIIALKIIRDISFGLHYLHSLHPPILHCDIRIPNIFIKNISINDNNDDDDVCAIIGDLGFSRIASLTNHRSGMKSVSSDIMGLGAIIYNLIDKLSTSGGSGGGGGFTAGCIESEEMNMKVIEIMKKICDQFEYDNVDHHHEINLKEIANELSLHIRTFLKNKK